MQNLTTTDIETIADSYLGDKGPLKEAFETKFERDLPEVLNEFHRSVVVAESIDDSTERVVRYLANFGVPINVATVQHFKHQPHPLLGQVFLIEPEVAQSSSRVDRMKERQALADEHDVGPLFAKIRCRIGGALHATGNANDCVWYTAPVADSHGSRRTVLKVWTSAGDKGEMRFVVHVDRFREYLQMTQEELGCALPENTQESQEVRKWKGATDEERERAIGMAGAFCKDEEVEKFLSALQTVSGLRS